MHRAGTPALPQRTPASADQPVPARPPRPCVTYINTLPRRDVEGPQRLLDDYAAAHGLDVVGRFVDHAGCVEPAAKPELQNALTALRTGQAQVLLVMSEGMISVLASERDAVGQEVTGSARTLAELSAVARAVAPLTSVPEVEEFSERYRTVCSRFPAGHLR